MYPSQARNTRNPDAEYCEKINGILNAMVEGLANPTAFTQYLTEISARLGSDAETIFLADGTRLQPARDGLGLFYEVA